MKMKHKKKLLSNKAIMAIIISLILISVVGITISMYRSSSEPISGKADFSPAANKAIKEYLMEYE